MLRIYEFDDLGTQNMLTELENARDIKVSREINGEYNISFYCPYDEKRHFVKENRLVKCEGQIFRIMKITGNAAQEISVFGEHIYNSDAKLTHLQNIPDSMGVKPSKLLRDVFEGTVFKYLSDKEIKGLDMTPVDEDGLLIDFFSMDKTTPYEAAQVVIQNCGKGELYIDNFNIALVESIGEDRGVRLNASDNLSELSVERDFSGVITRLYPYGHEDIHIGSANSDVQYVDSVNIGKYGIREGYRDYSDYSSPTDIKNRALWEFDEANEERIDVPSVNISGRIIDLAKNSGYDFRKIALGDKIRIEYDGDTYFERVIKIQRYPYEPKMGEISIGRVKKDLFFYLNTLGKLGNRYQKAITISGKLKTRRSDNEA